MTRRVVFAGGTQAKALAKAYRLDIAADRDEDVFFIGAESLAREAAHRVIASADIMVMDLTTSGATVPDALIPAAADQIAVPVVQAPFLWPFAGRPHPQNTPISALREGPYPADFGDSFLDSMMAEGAEPHEAVERYLALDIGYAAQLDEKLNSAMAALSALDAKSGFDLAGYVQRDFTRQNLFATLSRQRLPLFRHVAIEVFSRMGVPGVRAEAIPEAPFAPGAMPIHPGVLRHFGMAAPLPDHRYPVLDEGTFTFEQYCRRYMRYEWNERLHMAMALAESDPAEAIPLLRRALDISPGSRAGQLALEDAERAVAQRAGAAPLPLSTGQPTAVPKLRPATPPMPRPSEAAPPAPFGRYNAPARPPAVPEPVSGAFGEPPAEPVDLISDPLASDALPVYAEAEADQQPYVELGFSDFGSPPEESPAPRAQQRNRYEPLPPHAELIEVLPRMLPNTRGLASAADAPFNIMPETMPPPPLRPVLPPELRPDTDERKGLVARLFSGMK